MSQILPSQIKKLIYKSWHRGTREADLLLGPFAEKILPSASSETLEDFESMLSLPDQVLVPWIMGYAKENPAPRNRVLALLKKELEQIYSPPHPIKDKE